MIYLGIILLYKRVKYFIIYWKTRTNFPKSNPPQISTMQTFIFLPKENPVPSIFASIESSMIPIWLDTPTAASTSSRDDNGIGWDLIQPF